MAKITKYYKLCRDPDCTGDTPTTHALGDIDLSFLRSNIPIKTLSLSLPRGNLDLCGEHFSHLVSQILGDVQNVDSTVRLLMQSVKGSLFCSHEDIRNILDSLLFALDIQVTFFVKKMMVAWGQNNTPISDYYRQRESFSQLLKSIDGKNPLFPLLPLLEYKLKEILEKMSSFGFQSDKKSEVGFKFYSIPGGHESDEREIFSGSHKWTNTTTQQKLALVLNTELQKKHFPLSLQLLEAQSSAQNKENIALMFTPRSVYLHHSPRTIKNPKMSVDYRTFDAMLKDASDFGSLKDVICRHFEVPK